MAIRAEAVRRRKAEATGRVQRFFLGGEECKTSVESSGELLLLMFGSLGCGSLFCGMYSWLLSSA